MGDAYQTGFCDNPPALRYLNGGFFIGPVRALHKMVTWVMSNFYYIKGPGSDQRMWNEYALRFPEVTLDYVGSLILNIDGMNVGRQRGRPDVLRFRGPDVLHPVTN